MINEAAARNGQWLNSLADAYRSANDRERALGLLESAIEKMSIQNTWGLSESYQKVGTLYAQKGEKEKAQEAFRKMGTMRLLQGGGASYEKDQVARTYMGHEMWDDAEALYTEILNDFSTQRWDRDQAQRQLMEIKRRRDGLAKTTQTAKKAEKFNVGTQRVLAQQHVRQGEVKKAIDLYEQIVELMPEDFESRAELATLYTRRNTHDKAVDIWKGCLKPIQRIQSIRDGLVSTHQDADNITEAFATRRAIHSSGSGKQRSHVRLAKLYAAEDQVDDAIATYKKQLHLVPGDGKAYLELAQLHLRKDDLAAAEKAFEEAIERTGQDWERRNIERQLMTLYRRQGKLEEMLKAAEEAGTLTFEMQRERAQDYRNAGELEKAIKAYKKALDLTPQRWDRNRISNDLMQIYVQMGKSDLAMELYETASQAGSSGMSLHTGPFGVKIMFAGDEAARI